MKTYIYLSFVLLLFTACSVTKPKLVTGKYSNVSDDIVIYNSIQKAVEKLSLELDSTKKILLVQMVNDGKNDYLADRIYENLYLNGYSVKLTKNPGSIKNTGKYDNLLKFYPTVFGTETAQTKPTLWPYMAASIPVIGWLSSKKILSVYSYIDRYAAVSIHCRLVDAKTKKIVWIKNFSGNDIIRLEKDEFHKIKFPKK